MITTWSSVLLKYQFSLSSRVSSSGPRALALCALYSTAYFVINQVNFDYLRPYEKPTQYEPRAHIAWQEQINRDIIMLIEDKEHTENSNRLLIKSQ
jgi:hypothetical protein